MESYYMDFIMTAFETLIDKCEDGGYTFPDGRIINAKKFARETENKVSQLLRDEAFNNKQEDLVKMGIASK